MIQFLIDYQNYLINILLINLSIITIYESGFIDDLTKIIFKKLNPKKEYMFQQLPKPFSCWFCMCFWIDFIYLSYNNLPLIYSISISCIISYFNIYLRIGLLIIKRTAEKWTKYI